MITLEKEKIATQPTVKVIKRDGRSVNFDADKIYNALLKASNNVTKMSPVIEAKLESISDNIVAEIFDRFKDNVKIYEIQNIVEHELLEANEYAIAQEYINYRTKRDFARSQATDINFSIDKLLNKDQTVVNENANKDSEVFNTQRDLTAGIVGKSIGLKMLPAHVANAHQKGDIHFHDLDYSPYTPMTNCCLIDFKGMLGNGFKIGNAEVESPKSIQTATAQISQIIANVASSQYGGCTSNGQTPFTSLGFGLGTNWFEREIQKAILTIRIKGLGSEHRTAIFPKLIFTLKSGLNLEEGTPNYDIKQLALECATKRMYPDVLSYDKIVELTGSFKAPMGCRSFLQGWKDENGVEVNSGRMNLGVVTVNLPRIAMESNGDMYKFWVIFNERMGIAKDALVYRVERVKEATPANAPILYQYGAFGKRLGKYDNVDELFRHRRATVSLGYIGLYEVGTVFFGPNWETNAEAKEFTVDIIRKMKEYCVEWSDEYDYHFSIYSTPSESLTDRFCRLDTKKFGIVKDITDKEYYTNSFHYDVRKNPTPFEKLDFEKVYPEAGATGGFIHYCEYPVLQQNPKALEAVWDYAYTRVGYLGTNTPIDRCYKCGFEGDFTPTERGFVCPNCGNSDPKSVDVVKRTCGYLGNPQARPMVNGRHKEISARVKNMNGSTIKNPGDPHMHKA